MRQVIYLSMVIWAVSSTLTLGKDYGGGRGTTYDPYLIYAPEQMNAIGSDPNDWDKHFKLMADIDLGGYTGTDFNIIGTDEVNYFSGTFDGNDHVISNLTYNSTGTNYIGCFGFAVNAEIKNLSLTNCNIEATGYGVGGLVGGNWYGSIINCNVSGSVSGNSGLYGGLIGKNSGGYINYCYSIVTVLAGDNIGGLVGQNSGNISNCYSIVDIFGDWRTGGLVGVNYGMITKSYSSGSVEANARVGGLVGWNRPDGGSGIISNCYSNASVWANQEVGGLVGHNYANSLIENSYSTGGILGDIMVGGLIGYNSGAVNNSFWDKDTSLVPISAAGTGKTTEEMQTESTFTDAGWDFYKESNNGTQEIWTINEGVDYPRLLWQTSLLGDFVYPFGVNLFDYAFFANHWLEDNCGVSNNCDGTDLNISGTVDTVDLMLLIENWLVGSE